MRDRQGERERERERERVTEQKPEYRPINQNTERQVKSRTNV